MTQRVLTDAHLAFSTRWHIAQAAECLSAGSNGQHRKDQGRSRAFGTPSMANGQFSGLQAVGVNYDKANSPFYTLRWLKIMMSAQRKRLTLDGGN